MKKLTAGIFASLLAVVATGAAHAEIASKGYVDDINTTLTSAIGAKADTTTVNALDGRVEAAEGEIDTIQGTMETYGDVVTHNASEFATAAQGTKADTAVQPAAISDMQVKTNMVNTAGWATGKTDDTKYPSAAAVNTAITAATENIASSDTVEQIQTDLDAAEADIVELQTDKQDKNMGAEAANHIVTTDGTGNITSSATIEATKVTGLADVATSGAYDDLSGTPSLGTLASKNTITSDDITDGTIAEGDLNASINASLDKADTALQKTAADAAYAPKSTENTANTAASNAQQALTDIGTKSELTTTKKDNLVDAINELDAAMGNMATNETIQGIQTNLTELEGKVDTNTTNIGTNTTHIGTVGNLKTGVKTDLVSAVNEVKTQADKGVSDAATAQSAAEAAQSTATQAQTTATQAQTTANAAIPKPSGTCAEPENKCVLTYNNTVYAWEVIERGTSESSN